MALNLKTLGTRSLSAAVFVVLLIGSVLWNYYTFTLFFFIVAMIGLHEFYKIAAKLNAQPYKLTGFLAGIITYLAFINPGEIFTDADLQNILMPMIILLPFLVFSVALFNKRANPIQNALFTLMGVMYAVLPFALLHGIRLFNPALFPRIILGIIFLIWSNDTFAYLGGSLFGKNKMIERISPGKTWEGTIFGVLVTFGVSFLIRKFLVADDGVLWPVLGVVIPILATVGDLVESMLKRQAGIKDSGNIMPGHGGILDRFDSLIFVAPFLFVIMKLL
jgi:phosphatidate cytidylyltransferase